MYSACTLCGMACVMLPSGYSQEWKGSADWHPWHPSALQGCKKAWPGFQGGYALQEHQIGETRDKDRLLFSKQCKKSKDIILDQDPKRN